MKYTPSDGFPYYLNLMEEKNLSTLFSSMPIQLALQDIDDTKAQFRYAPNKWSIKQVLGHVIDHERIKMHRAFLLSRQVPVQLWGYDQDKLVRNSQFEKMSLDQLRADYKNVRQASISWIDSLSEAQLELQGKADNHIVQLDDFLRTVIGHELHHVQILQKKYL